MDDAKPPEPPAKPHDPFDFSDVDEIMGTDLDEHRELLRELRKIKEAREQNRPRPQ